MADDKYDLREFKERFLKGKTFVINVKQMTPSAT